MKSAQMLLTSTPETSTPKEAFAPIFDSLKLNEDSFETMQPYLEKHVQESRRNAPSPVSSGEPKVTFSKLEIDTSSSSSNSNFPRSPQSLVEEGYVSSDRVVLMSRDLMALKDMLEENNTCLVCKAASALIEDAVAKSADIPLRHEEWFEKNFCRDGDRGEFSSAFELPDWQYHSVHGTPSLNFQKNLRRTVTACTMILNMADAESLQSVITEKERKAARHLVAGNPYVVYGCHLRDKEIAPYERNEVFFRKLYRIRQRCGVNQDFGYASKVLYQAQSGGQEEDEDAEAAFVDEVPTMREKLRELFADGIDKVKDWASKVVSIFFRAIGSIFGLVSIAFGKIMDAVKSFCADVIRKLFDVEKLMQYCHTNYFKEKIIASIAVFCMLSVAVIFGLEWFITSKISNAIVRSFANHGFEQKLTDQSIKQLPTRHQHWLYKAQNSRADPVSCAVALGGMIWNFTGSETAEIKKKANIAMDLMKLGTVVSSVTTCVYALMPVVLKEAIASMIESPTDRMKRSIYEWCSLSNELSKLQQISSVIAHPHFKLRVDAHLKEGVELLKKITGPTFSDVRGFMTSSLMQLYKLATILLAMSLETLKRDEPYSVHVCGKPGVGKSLIVESILQRAHNISMEQIYAKNCGEVFYSGYHNGHKAVIMDEFCVGSSNVREEVARQYLGLVSSSQTRLEMASLNDPRVGIKGTCFSSDYIYTINNTAYDTVEGIPREALWRRRDVVVELEFSSNPLDVRRKIVERKDDSGQITKMEEGIDFSKYTPAEIYDAIWVQATVRPGSPPDGCVEKALTSHPLSLPALCEFLKEREEKFRERQALVREAFGSTISDRVDPMLIIDNVFRKNNGLPEVETDEEKAKSLPQKLFGVFFGQGPARPVRHNHICPHCGTKRRHKLGDSYSCEHCAENSECTTNGEPPEEVEPPTHDSVFKQGEYEHELHRIACLNVKCTRQKAVKKEEGVCEDWMCPDCLPKFEKAENVIEINRSRLQLPLRKALVHKDLESWKRAVASELDSIPMQVWSDLVVPTIAQYRVEFEPFATEFSSFYFGFRLMSFAGVLLTAVALRRMRVAMGDTKEEEITFGPPADFEGQALYDRSTRTKAPRSSLFAKRGQKGAAYKSQAGGLVKSLKLRIGNANLVCCPIGGRDLLLFHHAIVDPNGNTIEGPIEMSLTVGKEVYEGVYTDEIVRSFPERDFMVLRFPNKRLPSFKDVRRYFMFRDSVDAFQGKCLIKVDSPRSEMYARCDVIPASYTAHGHVYEMPKLVRYHCDTMNGDCGSPVFCASGEFTGTMIGIHVAGTGDSRNPQGLATFVAREDLDELIELFEEPEDFPADFSAQNMDSVENYQSMIAAGELPNLKEVVSIPKGRQMHCSDKSKLKPSLLSTVLDWVPEKAPAILSDRDPRANGLDPIDVAVKKLGKIPVNDWSDELKKCGEIALADMKVKYQKILRESGHFDKILTTREAIAGVPGLIKSIDTSTCAGYPIGCTANKNGKKSVIHHENSECIIDENFLRLCDQLEEDMLNYDGGEIDYAFQAFGKDELRSQKKLKNVDTRLTYANDIIFNAVVRKRTAPLMLALCKTFGKHGMAISLNPQSNDMHKIYSYLREAQPEGELGVIDGDYSEFDIRHPEWVIRKIFRFICDLMKDIEPNEKFWDYVIKHEVDCGATVKNILYRFRSILCSGSLFTTLFNCFVNEFYFRVLFIRWLKWLSFDKEARIVVLGDDHLLALSKMVDWFPTTVGEMMTALGLKYTSARKNEELRDVRTPFGECLFLGSVPQNHHGLWSGALRKETLRESILWTRNKDRSMDAEVTQMIEAASQWDKEYFTWYVDTLRSAYEQLGRPFPEPSGSWEGLGRSVANRTTDSGADFPIYRAQMEGAVESQDNNVHVDGMTTLKTDTEVNIPTPPQLNARSLIGKAVNERDADLGFGPRSLMKRNTVTWSSANAAGTALQTNSCPFGLLSMGDQHNLQNMAFQNFLYTTTNVKVVFQVNGTPTQAGLAIAYFVPLLNFTPDRDSKPSFQKVWITPNMNTTVELNIDFNYWRSTLNTLNAAYFPEVMGYVKIDVYSPLISLAAATCDITTYVAFEADFKIPRPFAVPAVDGTAPLFGVSKNSGGTLNVAPGTYVGQGSNVSTTNVNNSYQVGDIGGDMPIQAGVDGGGKLSQTADVQAVPMDNPPVSGGAVPTVGQFSSMSKSNGAEITTALQLHQQEMSYQPIKMRAALDTNIQELCGKQGRVANFAWNTTQLNGTSLYTLNLDSCFSMFGINSIATSTQLPTNVAVLNQFMFWRGDFVFDVCVVKTAFHSGRIMASVAYGDNTVNLSELNVYMNNVLDFNGDAAWQSFRVNYNNSQEYLRTWNGPGSARARDVSLGTLQFSVLNELRATSEVVSSAVDVLLFVRFENVRVAVPKPMPIVNIQTTQPPFIAQGDNVLSGASDAPDQGPTEVVDTTASVIRPPPARPCKLTFGEKFDYTVSDVHELVRRHVPLPMTGPPTSKSATANSAFGIQKYSGGVFNVVNADEFDVWRIPARLNCIWNHMYAGWSGHVKFRIFVYGSQPGLVWYVPHDLNPSFTVPTDAAEVVLGPADTRIATGTGTDVFHSTQYPGNIPREMTYPYTSNCSMIDVSVPFCSQYNILPNWERRVEVPDALANWDNGYLYLRVIKGTHVEIFQAAGDDFRFHVYCPDNGVRGKLLQQVGATTTAFASGDRIGGYYK